MNVCHVGVVRCCHKLPHLPIFHFKLSPANLKAETRRKSLSVMMSVGREAFGFF